MNRQTFLPTKNLDLVLVAADDAPTIAQWFNDLEVTQYLGRGYYPMTEVRERDYLENMYKDEARLVFGIWAKSEEKLVGVVGLHRIDHINQTAELGICIGEKTAWGKGYGTETINALTSHAFGRLNLRHVYLRVLGNNPRGKRCYEKCGFVETGRFKDYILKDGTWYDEIFMLAKRPTLSR